MRHVLWTSLALAGLACAPALLMPTDADRALAESRYPGTTLADLRRGRAIYADRCGSCHALHLPDDLPPDRWPHQLDKMAVKAKLSQEEHALVERFLVVAASGSSRTAAR